MSRSESSVLSKSDAMASYTGDRIHSWQQWRKLWDSARLLPIHEGLVHCAFSVRCRSVQEEDERLDFLLKISDEEAIRFPRHSQEQMAWRKFRKKVRSVLALSTFKHFYPPHHEVTSFHIQVSEYLRSPEVLDTLVWLFRLDENGEPRNLPNQYELMGERTGSVHVAHLWRDFAISFVLHTWFEEDPDHYPLARAGRHMEPEEVSTMKQRLQKARPALIPILGYLQASDYILDPRYRPDPASRRVLEYYARGAFQGAQGAASSVRAAATRPASSEVLVARNLIVLDALETEGAVQAMSRAGTIQA